MPVNSGNYNNDAILGAQIERLVKKALQKYVEGSNVIAEMGNNFDARLKAVEDVLKSSNVGAFVADSVETQSLKVGGEDLKTVAFTGSYNDLSNKPAIPAAVTVDQTYSASSTNPQSGKAVAGAIANKQDKLGTSGSGSSLKYTINISGTAGSADKATTVTVNSMSSTDRYVAFVDENGNIYKGSATYNLANNTLVCNLSGNATSATNASGYSRGGGIDLAIQQLQTAISGKEDKLVSGGTYNINVSKVGGYAIVVGPYSGVANTIYLY